jgi:glycosyltransferase involved in cell wall biosynthesis
MKILFVVQRYGIDIDGGAELYCRWLAEHVAKTDDVTVLTTTARDYTTWDNFYKPGKTVVNCVPVIRMPVAFSRRMSTFNDLTEKLLSTKASDQQLTDWIMAQGPWSPELFKYLEDNHDQYDLLVFMTYLYATSVIGTTVCPSKSLLIPTAHDEPVAHLRVFHELYKRIAGLFYLTQPEKTFVESVYMPDTVPSVVLGTGIEIPESLKSSEIILTQYGIQKPFLFYMGRVEKGKGCSQLAASFLKYKECFSSSLTLVLSGRKHIDLTDTDSIICTGFIPDEDVKPLIDSSDIVVIPSPYESLSILLLQAFACRKPVLANALSPVLKAHCIQSNGGLFYTSEDEFFEALFLLESKAALRDRLGKNGFRYVQQNYTWAIVVERFRSVCLSVLNKME